MEILLMDNDGAFIVQRLTTGDTLFKVDLIEAEWNTDQVLKNSAQEEYRKKVIDAAQDYVKTVRRNRKTALCFHIKKNPENPHDKNKCLVRVHGFLWSENNTVPVEGVRMRIQLCIYPLVNSDTEVDAQMLCAEFPIHPSASARDANVPLTNEGCIGNEGFSEVKNVTFYWYGLFRLNLGSSPKFYSRATLTLISDRDDVYMSAENQLAFIDNEQMAMNRICRQILVSKLHCDVVIVDRDGADFPCNKVFLAAHSPVFASMLESDMKGLNTGKIELQDLTSDGIKALLEYIYTCDLERAGDNCDTALELLQAGYKYEIEALKKKVISILSSKDVEWFNVDTAFNLFLFARKVESMVVIKMKAASVLKVKRQELVDSSAYKKELEENPTQATNAVLELFCLVQE